MSKLLIGLALSLVATAASAEWVLVTEDSSRSKFYADPTTKKRSGNIVRLWFMQNFPSAQKIGGKSYLSVKVFQEFDCKEDNARITSMVLYSELMGSGVPVDSLHTPNEPWAPVPPGTARQTMLHFACK
jgi:hypothetical protein